MEKESMNEKMIFAFGGSFNPPHMGHTMAIQSMLDMGATRVHVFVRINEGVDLVDRETKIGWFNQMKEKYKDIGWDKVVIHEAVSNNVKGKQYSLATVRNGINMLHEQAGETITHYYAGDDYKKFKPFWRLIGGNVKLVIGARMDGLSSSEIRNNLDRRRYLLEPFVYEDLKKKEK